MSEEKPELERIADALEHLVSLSAQDRQADALEDICDILGQLLAKVLEEQDGD